MHDSGFEGRGFQSCNNFRLKPIRVPGTIPSTCARYQRYSETNFLNFILIIHDCCNILKVKKSLSSEIGILYYCMAYYNQT